VASGWGVEITAPAQAGVDQMLEEEGEDCYRATLEAIEDLATEPTPSDSLQMRGTKDYYRIYVCRNRWRLIYRALFATSKILVIRVGPRPAVYRGFERW
jgi:mRNA-degrading endonuclease RelE of RelBE toxin-antitoxin system